MSYKLFLLTVLVSSNVFAAAKTAPKQVVVETPSVVTTTQSSDWNRTREALRGLSVFGFLSTASDLTIKQGGASTTASTDNALGFGAEYKFVLPQASTSDMEYAVVGGGTYEASRTIPANIQPKPSFSLWTVYTNAQVTVNNKLAAFGGLNYSIPMEKNFGNEKIKSDLGFQVGASLNATPSFALDGAYRWINVKVDGVESVRLDGFLFRGRYMF